MNTPVELDSRANLQKPRHASMEAARLRQQLLVAGAARMSEIELLVLVLGAGRSSMSAHERAQDVLNTFGGLSGLARAAPEEVVELPGIGTASASRLVAALELGRRVLQRPWLPGESFVSSLQVFEHFRWRLQSARQEHFFALYLDARNRLLGEREISKGSLVATIVHPREVFRPAIQLAAAAVICVHNHPSGDPQCSSEDVSITRRLFAAGELVGIDLLDHLVLGFDRYVSFVDQGLDPFGPARLDGSD